MPRNWPGFFRCWRPGIWTGLLGFCVAFGAVRVSLELARHRDRVEWETRSRLIGILWDQWRLPTAEVESGILGHGKPLNIHPTSVPAVRSAQVAGETLGPEYRGWILSLNFSTSVDGMAQEIMVGGQVIPPPGAVLRRGPTELWWAVEYCRAIIMLGAMVAWAAGIVLICIVKKVRRAVANFCIAAALLSMFCAVLEVDIPLKQGFFPGWRYFEVAGGMALLAIFFRIIPAPSIQPGRCRNCGYDLTGNESGICPECGVETANHFRQKRLAELSPAADRLENITLPALELGIDEELADGNDFA